MALDKHLHHPDITVDMQDQINEIIETNRDIQGSLITVLRECQNIVGYLPVELIDYIGYGLNIPRSRVYGVATFYSFFSLAPKGRNIIRVCMGTACYVKGIKDVTDRISSKYQLKEGGITDDRRFSLEAVRCLGACGLAPVMVVNQDIHGIIKSEEVLELIDKYE